MHCGVVAPTYTMLKTFLPLSALLLLAACSTVSPPSGSAASSSVRYQQARFSDLPDWGSSMAAQSLEGLRLSCRTLQGRPAWKDICAEAASLDAANLPAVTRFYENRFTPWQISEQGKDSGLITGYFEPLLAGGVQQSAQTPFPVYGVPADLRVLDASAAQLGAEVVVAKPAGGNRLQVVPGKTRADAGELLVYPKEFVIDSRTRALKGRIEQGRLRPYYTRAEINAGKGVNTAPVLAWVENDTELFFLQVQGSGRIQLEDGRYLRAGYAEQNGHGYKSIGRWLVDNGQMKLSDVSMQSIKEWIAANPGRKDELFNANPSYVFFKTLPADDNGPLGALGVPLLGGYSIAVDPRYIPLGAPVYLSTTWPLDGPAKPLNRLVNAQDTGGAIRGGVRADFFFGFGTEAGLYAGRMKQSGRLWLLWPRGLQPQANP